MAKKKRARQEPAQGWHGPADGPPAADAGGPDRLARRPGVAGTAAMASLPLPRGPLGAGPKVPLPPTPVPLLSLLPSVSLYPLSG